MRLTDKRKRRLKNILIAIAIICITPLCEKGRMLCGIGASKVFAGKNLICVIDLGNGMYSPHGLEAGFHYELMQQFAIDNNCNIRIISAKKGENYQDSLKNGRIDILITHKSDSLTGIRPSRQIDEGAIWAVKSSKDRELRQINNWISHTILTGEYQKLKSRFNHRYDPIRYAETGRTTKTLSPYDDILKKYADELGWDWRMLAAVVYQESKFAINSHSYRGAQGLMQVMPRTGEYYGVDDLLDPETNISAGVSHLKRLQNLYRKESLGHDELIKFTLATYNAGEGRIGDCRSLAAANQIDSTRWSEVIKVIPLMREDSILENPAVRHGKFHGLETMEYVEKIMEIYKAFCTICPQI